ncbi:pyrroline-5-carboxylate reductase, partial [Candidatus Saccharibacteria bacterium]|nr:pyrroline-5-carboxylate reductase [Candidatus Saccharibacteria bacterium]
MNKKEKSVMNVGFIGVGNMGGAILRVAVQNGIVKPEEVFVCRRHPEKGIGDLPEGVRLLSDAKAVAEHCKRIILAVKPQQADIVLKEMKPELSGSFIVSVMAGWNFARLIAALPKDARVLPVMPNTPLSVGEGMTLFSDETNVTLDERDWALRLFTSGGRVEIVSEAVFNAANAISGCGPAFAYLFVEALADGAVRGGLQRDSAYR